MLGDATSRIMLGVLALLAISQTANGQNVVVASPSTIALTCSTSTGPGTNATINIKPRVALTGSSTVAVTLGTLPNGVIAVTTPSVQTLSTANQTAGINYVVNFRAGCGSATAGTATTTFRFNAGGTADATITTSTTVTATASALVASPAPITITCVKSGSTYTPSAAKTLAVTSAATGGTPFTVDTSTNPPASWLTVTPTTGGTAGTSAVNLSLSAAAGCGSFASGTTNTTTMRLLNAPAPDKAVIVNLVILTPSPLTTTPASPRLSYTKGSGNAGFVDVSVASTTVPAPFFTVDTTTLPIWLTVDSTTGRTTKTIRFSSTTIADTLAPGTYSASINIKVAGSADLVVPMSVLVTNPAPRLSVAEGITRNISWNIGNLPPTPVITAVSTDSPISYTITTGGALAPIVAANQLSGLAYSFGTQIPVSFDPTILASAEPGTVLTGTVTLSWGSPSSTIVVTFNLTILSPGAVISTISPASVPTAVSPRNFTIVLSGSGFIASPDPSVRTRVGIVSTTGSIVTNNNISANVVNPSSIILTVTVPTGTDTALPFAPTGSGGTVPLGVCNPVGGACTAPTGTATLTIGTGPIVQVVTSASSFVQVNPGGTPTVAPYDIISIFGANFCSSGGTGCSSNQILYGAPDEAGRYPSFLSPDAAGATQRQLAVRFQTRASTPVVLGSAPLLFATNGQINLLVPSTVTPQIGNGVDMVVTFGYGSTINLLSSPPFGVNIAATNPGIFTVGANGQGTAAALSARDYSFVNAGREAGMRSTASDSDTVLLYVTGLGAPDSTADNASTGSSAWSGDCVSPSSYLTSLNATTGGSLTTADGLIMASTLFSVGRLAPCVLSNSANVPTITVGGQAGTVLYAGWIGDAVAGLYQINAKLPGSVPSSGSFTDSAGSTLATITAPVQLPVVITAASRASQSGVNLWVAPKLKVVAPTTRTGTVGTAWGSSSNAVVATQGTSPYRYAVTSGLLPPGLALGATTGAITGTPAANTSGSYAITVTATDSANVPLRDSVTFTLTIAGGLVVSASGTSPYTVTYGTSNATLTTVSATGGTYPYTYAITAPGTIPTGMLVNASTGVISMLGSVPAGTYNVTVTATDAAGTALTGTASFAITVHLNVTNATPTAGTNGQVNASLTTVTATGQTGAVAYALASGSPAWLAVHSSTGVVSTTNAAVAGTVAVTVNATDGTAPSNAASAGTGTVTFNITIN